MIVKTAQVITTNGNSVEFYTNNSIGKVLLIGCFHGDEPQGKVLIEKYLKHNQDSNLMMIPCLNPDGYFNSSRVNANNVDLNRNFPTKNWEYFDKDMTYFSGMQSASEIETQFLINVIEKYEPKLIITLHAPYKIVNYDGNAQEIAQKISDIIGYPVQKDIGYPTPGSFGTWAGVERNIPVITLELDEEIDVKELEAPVFRIFKMLETL